MHKAGGAGGGKGVRQSGGSGRNGPADPQRGAASRSRGRGRADVRITQEAPSQEQADKTFRGAASPRGRGRGGARGKAGPKARGALVIVQDAGSGALAPGMATASKRGTPKNVPPRGCTFDVPTQLQGVKDDIDRFYEDIKNKEMADRVAAVCRVLNDLNKYDDALWQLFSGIRKDTRLCESLVECTLEALKLANGYLEAAAPQMLGEWPICQMFNALRGLFSCGMLMGGGLEEHMEQAAGLAANLVDCLSNPAVLVPSKASFGKEAWDLLPHEQFTHGVESAARQGLFDPSKHLPAMLQYLDAIAASADEEGWDIQGIANTASALSNWPLKPAHLAPAARTVVGLIAESIHDPYQRPHWNPQDCVHARRGLERMIALGINITADGEVDPLFARTLDDLQALVNGEPLAAVLVPAPPTTVVPVVAVVPDETEAASPGHLPGQPANTAPAKVEPPGARHPAPRARTAAKPQVRADSHQSAALQTLAGKKAPRKIARAIDQLGPQAPDTLKWATAEKLSQWLTLIASTNSPTGICADAVQMLAGGVAQCALRQEMPARELASLLYALGKALNKFPTCAGEVKAAMRLLSGQLSRRPPDGMKLALICGAVQGLIPLLGESPEANEALVAMINAVPGAKGTLQAEELCLVSDLFRAMNADLGRPAVRALLERLTTYLEKNINAHAKPENSARLARTTAAVEIISNTPLGAADELIAGLVNALLQGPGQTPLTLEQIQKPSARRALVCGLMVPLWGSQDKKGDLVVLLPGNASRELLVWFMAGFPGFRTRFGKPVDLLWTDGKELDIVDATFEVCRRVGMYLDPENGNVILRLIINYIDFAAHLAARVGASQKDAFKAVLHLVGSLSGLGDELTGDLVAQLPDVPMAKLIRQLQAIEYGFVDGVCQSWGFSQAQREKVNALERLMGASSSLPRWIGEEALGPSGGISNWLSALSQELADAVRKNGDLLVILSRASKEAAGFKATEAQEAAGFLEEQQQLEELLLWIYAAAESRDPDALADAIHGNLLAAMPAGLQLAAGASGGESDAVPPPPKNMGDALTRLDWLIDKQDVEGLEALAELIPTLGPADFNYKALDRLVPRLSAILRHEAGRAAVLALARRMEALFAGPNALLDTRQAMTLTAHIASSLLGYGQKDANDVVCLWMDIIARKCCRESATVKFQNNWWEGMRLDTARSKGRFDLNVGNFVFQIMQSLWKVSTHPPMTYAIPPAGVGDALVRSFMLGKQSIQPLAATEAENFAQHSVIFEAAMASVKAREPDNPVALERFRKEQLLSIVKMLAFAARSERVRKNLIPPNLIAQARRMFLEGLAAHHAVGELPEWASSLKMDVHSFRWVVNSFATDQKQSNTESIPSMSAREERAWKATVAIVADLDEQVRLLDAKMNAEGLT